MKFINNIVIIPLMIVLVSCSINTGSQNIKPEKLFNHELKNLYSVYESVNKVLINDVSEDNIKNIIKGIVKNIEYSDLEINFEESNKGIVRNNEEIITVLKVPTKIKLKADEKNMKQLLNEFALLEQKIIVGDIFINQIDNFYELNCSVIFCGELVEESDNSEVKIAIEEITGKINKTNQIVLRDSNLLMILRPYNSDSASLSLGLTNDSEGTSYVYYDNNEKINLTINFVNENNKYYCEYENIYGNVIKSEFKLKNNRIIFDILSCEIKEKEDVFSVDLEIINNTNKVIDVKIFDDADARVKVVSDGYVEVSK